MAELSPQQFRSKILSCCFLIKFGIFQGYTFALDALMEQIGILSFIPLYIVPAYGFLIILWFYLPETKNREIHQVITKLMEDNHENVKTIEP